MFDICRVGITMKINQNLSKIDQNPFKIVKSIKIHEKSIKIHETHQVFFWHLIHVAHISHLQEFMDGVAQGCGTWSMENQPLASTIYNP